MKCSNYYTKPSRCNICNEVLDKNEFEVCNQCSKTEEIFMNDFRDIIRYGGTVSPMKMLTYIQKNYLSK